MPDRRGLALDTGGALDLISGVGNALHFDHVTPDLERIPVETDADVDSVRTRREFGRIDD